MNRNPSQRLIALFSLTTFAVGIASTHAQGPMPEASAEHKGLQHEVGTWDAEVKTWMAPGTEPLVSKGSETNTMLGDLWLLSDYQGDMMGMTYKGHGKFGYDPIKKKYVGTWVDNVSPHLSTMEGTMDETTKTLTMYSKGIDFMTGKESSSKMVSTMIDHDHKKFEIYGPVEGQEGKWWKKMEFNYTRRK